MQVSNQIVKIEEAQLTPLYPEMSSKYRNHCPLSSFNSVNSSTSTSPRLRDFTLRSWSIHAFIET